MPYATTLGSEYSTGVLAAVLLNRPREHYVELSLRLARSDPWRDLDVRWRLGQTVPGVVTGTQPYGAFIEIEPGVTGLLHHSRLPVWAQSAKIENIFWPGDQVRVTIELINLLKIGGWA